MTDFSNKRDEDFLKRVAYPDQSRVGETSTVLRFDESLIEREGAHGYDMGKSPSQHAYEDGSRLGKAWTRGWFSRKAALERKAHY